LRTTFQADVSAQMNTFHIHDFLQGRVELDCPRVELKSSTQEHHGTSLEGSGSISLDTDGTFRLKFYFSRSFDLEEIFENLNWDAGTLIPDNAYYDLIAHEVSGDIWTAERIILDRSCGPNGSLILAKIPELKKHEENTTRSDKAVISYYFNRHIRVPLNTVVSSQELVGDLTRNASMGIRLAKFKAANILFEIEEIQGHTRLVASMKKDELNDFVIRRVYESFCFVTANSSSWSCLVVSAAGFTETRIRAFQTIPVDSRIFPPIGFKVIDPTNSWWHLFDCYLTYILDTRNDYFHPLSSALFSVLESGRASLDAEALTLSTSIEAILKDQIGGLFDVPASLSRNITIARDVINASPDLDDAFKRRLEGTLGSMMRLRAKDILHLLKSRALIDDELVSIYGPIRDGSAHGERMSGGDLQNYINKLHSVLVLFYHLVFLVFKYEGPYSDYGTYGFPVKTFSGRLAVDNTEQAGLTEDVATL
jgi:hypothetical protein